MALTKSTNRMTSGAFANVKDFGATGDGTTDDTSAIQAAANAAGSSGTSLYFPVGEYKITTAITVSGFATYPNRGRTSFYGAGDGTVIKPAGCSAFLLPDQGYYRFSIENMILFGDNTSNIPAIDMSPTTVTNVVAGLILSKLRIRDFKIAFKMKNAQLNYFNDLDVDFTTASCKVFEVVPDSGTGQQCNSNRIHRMRTTGDGTMLDVTLPTATERASNWSFVECDIQFSGSQIPFYLIDGYNIIERCEFENSTAAYLIHMESTGTSFSPSYNNITSNILIGGSSATKIKITKSGTQTPYRNTIINNDGGSGNFLDDGGASTYIINNNGSVTDSASTSFFRHFEQNGVLQLVNNNAGSNKGGLVVDAISKSATLGKNLSGQVTFASAATATVTFAADRQEPNANYSIILGGEANETFWVTSKATTGFTVNSSNSSSTATASWMLIR